MVTSMICAQPVKMAGKSITLLGDADFNCGKYILIEFSNDRDTNGSLGNSEGSTTLKNLCKGYWG